MLKFLKQSGVHENLEAVYEKDIVAYFEKLGIKKEIDDGKFLCYCCNEAITLESFRALIKKNGKILFACNKDACVMKLASDTKD